MSFTGYFAGKAPNGQYMIFGVAKVIDPKNGNGPIQIWRTAEGRISGVTFAAEVETHYVGIRDGTDNPRTTESTKYSFKAYRDVAQYCIRRLAAGTSFFYFGYMTKNQYWTEKLGKPSYNVILMYVSAQDDGKSIGKNSAENLPNNLIPDTVYGDPDF